MSHATELRLCDGNGHAPAVPDPERERWTTYWQAMSEESQAHIRDAFDHVARCYEAGETEGYIAIATFCAEEAHGSVYRAIATLISRYSCEIMMSKEIAWNHAHGQPVDIDELIDTARSVLAAKA